MKNLVMALSRVCAALVLLLAGVVLLGWILDIEILARMLASWQPTAPLLAILLFCVSLSLLLPTRLLSTRGFRLFWAVFLLFLVVGFTAAHVWIFPEMHITQIHAWGNIRYLIPSLSEAIAIVILGFLMFFRGTKSEWIFWPRLVFEVLLVFFGLISLLVIPSFSETYQAVGFLPQQLPALLFLGTGLSLTLRSIADLLVMLNARDSSLWRVFIHFPIKIKLRLSFGVLVLLLLLFSLLAFFMTARFQYGLLSIGSNMRSVQEHLTQLATAHRDAYIFGRLAQSDSLPGRVAFLTWERTYGKVQGEMRAIVEVFRNEGREKDGEAYLKLLEDVTDYGSSFTAMSLQREDTQKMEEVFYEGRSKIDGILEQSSQMIRQYTLSIAAYAEILQQLLFVYIIFFIAIGLGFAGVMAKVITKPILELTSYAKSLRRGRITTFPHIGSKDEIGVLATAFSKLTQELLTSNQTLRQANLSITEAKVKNETILESIGEGVIATDESGTILYMNSMAKTLLRLRGLKDQTSLFSVRPLSDEDGTLTPERHPFTLAMKERKVVTMTDLTYLLPRGKVLPISLTIAPILLHEGMAGAIMVFRDFTKERQIDTAKSEFVSLASHQLRTPLTAMKWYLELLLEDPKKSIIPQESRTELLNEAYTNSIRMNSLVNSLLNVSRLELGKISPEPQSVEPCRILEDVMHYFSQELREKDISLAYLCDRHIQTVFLDPKLFRMIIENLLSNAVHYTNPKGEIRLSVHNLKPKSSFQGHPIRRHSLAVVVEDNGMGIPKKQQAKVFSKLFRADNVRSIDTVGSGLGLYIASSFAKTMGGQVWFVSQEGKGSRFTVTFPFEESTPSH